MHKRVTAYYSLARISLFAVFIVLISTQSISRATAAQPSTAPSQTVGSQFASLDGTVTWDTKDSKKVAGATIFDTTGSSSGVAVATTDQNGHYHVESIDILQSAKRSYQARKDGFTVFGNGRSITLAPKPATNTLDFSIHPNNNEVSGKVTNPDGSPAVGQNVILAKKGIDRIVETTTSDRNGKYDISMSPSAAGEYQTLVLIRDNTGPVSIGESQFFTFPDDYTDTATADIILTQKTAAPTFTVTISAYSTYAQLTLPDFERTLSGVNITLINTDTNQTVAHIDSGNPLIATNVPPGEYEAVAKKAGYKDASKTFSITVTDSDKFIAINMETTNLECVSHPQPHMGKEFWFCGDEAKQQYAALAGKPNDPWQTIDTTIGSLRQSTGYDDLPQQVFIISSRTQNAAYLGVAAGSDGACPIPLTPPDPGDGERIVITTAEVAVNDTSNLIDTTTHEFGHGFDHRQGQSGSCVGNYSGRPAFSRVAVPYLNDMNGFCVALKDGTYQKADPEAGHPCENLQEAFASAFMIARRHLSGTPPILQSVMDSLHISASEQKDILDLVNITTSL